MLTFPSMLLAAAEKAGMKAPNLQDCNEEFDAEQFPHFEVYCNMQLGRAIIWGEHWENAKIIAAIPEDKLRTITMRELHELGCKYLVVQTVVSTSYKPRRITC